MGDEGPGEGGGDGDGDGGEESGEVYFVVVSADLGHIVQLNIDYAHQELLRAKLEIVVPIVAVAIVFDALSPAAVAVAVPSVADKVSAAPSVSDALSAEKPAVAALSPAAVAVAVPAVADM
jgi:hypothetical protein